MRRSRGGKKHPAAGRPPRVARRHGGHGGHGECYGGTPRRPRRRQTPQRPRRLLLQRLLLRRPRRLQARRSRRLRARRRPLPRRSPRLPQRPSRLHWLLRGGPSNDQLTPHHNVATASIARPSTTSPPPAAAAPGTARTAVAALCTRMTNFCCVYVFCSLHYSGLLETRACA